MRTTVFIYYMHTYCTSHTIRIRPYPLPPKCIRMPRCRVLRKGITCIQLRLRDNATVVHWFIYSIRFASNSSAKTNNTARKHSAYGVRFVCGFANAPIRVAHWWRSMCTRQRLYLRSDFLHALRVFFCCVLCCRCGNQHERPPFHPVYMGQGNAMRQ